MYSNKEILEKFKQIDELCLMAFDDQKYGWIVHVNKIKEITEEILKDNNGLE